VSKELVISATRHETRVATLEDDSLVEISIERASEHALAGNIYKGRVSRVLPGMQSAGAAPRHTAGFSCRRAGIPESPAWAALAAPSRLPVQCGQPAPAGAARRRDGARPDPARGAQPAIEGRRGHHCGRSGAIRSGQPRRGAGDVLGVSVGEQDTYRRSGGQGARCGRVDIQQRTAAIADAETGPAQIRDVCRRRPQRGSSAARRTAAGTSRCARRYSHWLRSRPASTRSTRRENSARGRHRPNRRTIRPATRA